MTTKQQILDHDAVRSHNDWVSNGMDRTYINLAVAAVAARGHKTCKIYIDNKTNTLVFVRGRGTTSYDYEAAVDALFDLTGTERGTGDATAKLA